MTTPPGSSYAAAALLLVALLGLAGCGDDDSPGTAADPATTPAGPVTTEPTSPTSPTSGSGPSGTSSSDGTGGPTTVAAPLYFVGDTSQGPRLFREFQQVAGDDPVDEALAGLAAGDSLDPDYRTLLPPGSIHLTSHDENAVVEVDPSWVDRPAGMSKQEARLALQQIVYTVRGGLQLPVSVAFTVGDRPSPVFGIDTSGGTAAAPELDVLALVNITTPEQGAVVSGTFTATGVASSFEGTVPWQLVSADGGVVAAGAAQADGYVDKLYPWTTEIDLADVAPGDYTFAVSTDDPSGGEGAGPTTDTKAITVQ